MLEKICEKLTNHRFRKLVNCTVDLKPAEYYYKCKICGVVFWNYNKPNKKQLKGADWYKENL